MHANLNCHESQFSSRKRLRNVLQDRGCCCQPVDAETVVAAAVRLADDAIAYCHPPHGSVSGTQCLHSASLMPSLVS